MYKNNKHFKVLDIVESYWHYRMLVFLFLLSSNFSISQSKINQFLIPSDTLNTSRRTTVYISEAAILGATLVGLNQLWYKDYEKSKFHFINSMYQYDTNHFSNSIAIPDYHA